MARSTEVRALRQLKLGCDLILPATCSSLEGFVFRSADREIRCL
jgi:hypothetical protein